jgi:hypothetical protein
LFEITDEGGCSSDESEKDPIKGSYYSYAISFQALT